MEQNRAGLNRACGETGIERERGATRHPWLKSGRDQGPASRLPPSRLPSRDHIARFTSSHGNSASSGSSNSTPLAARAKHSDLTYRCAPTRHSCLVPSLTPHVTSGSTSSGTSTNSTNSTGISGIGGPNASSSSISSRTHRLTSLASVDPHQQ